jgi:hypothetical protein
MNSSIPTLTIRISSNLLNRMSRTLLGVSFLFGCTLVCMSASAFAADMEFKPFIAVSEEFNDNILETQTNRRDEFITRVQPGATFRYKAPLWNWDLAYSFDYLNYARGSKGDEYNHDAGLKGNISLIDNFFYLDVSDSYHRISLDITRDVTLENPFLNQTDQNIATVSPYLLWRPSDKTTLKTGYRYIDTRYWGSGIEKREHGAFADLNHELTSRFSISADYAFSKSVTTDTNFDRHDISGGFRYNYADKSFIFGSIGNSWQSFSNGIDTSNLFWTAGITHDLGVAVATLDTRVQFSEDPLTNSTKETIYSGKIDKELKRGAMGFSSSYSEYVTTQTGVQDQRKLAFGATGRYELLPGLTGNLAATGERFSIRTPTDYPYRMTGTGGLSYAFNHDITLGLTYTYVIYLYGLDTTGGAKEINRAVVEVRKVF